MGWYRYHKKIKNSPREFKELDLRDSGNSKELTQIVQSIVLGTSAHTCVLQNSFGVRLAGREKCLFYIWIPGRLPVPFFPTSTRLPSRIELGEKLLKLRVVGIRSEKEGKSEGANTLRGLVSRSAQLSSAQAGILNLWSSQSLHDYIYLSSLGYISSQIPKA